MDGYTEQKLLLNDLGAAVNIFGNQDEHLEMIEKNFQVKIFTRDGEIVIAGETEDVGKTAKLFKELINFYKKGNVITPRELNYAINMIQKHPDFSLAAISSEIAYTTHRGKQIKPKTLGQIKYLQAIKNNDIVFGIGPAGTGKTYLAVVMAVKALKNKTVNRIILTRPAVEAGEKLGFLPGDLQEKVDPYLRPIYDSLYDVLGVEITQRYIEKGIIEIAPSAYMRGRTLDDSYIILDEAQNTTREQMKMFLTRIGFNSRAIITGDITQVDLPKGQKSGLVEAVKILNNIDGIEFHYLTQADIVRHPLVQKIVEAYENISNANINGNGDK